MYKHFYTINKTINNQMSR